MKYSMEEYRKELDKAHEITCLRDAIDEIMASYREKLYQGLEVGDGVTVHLWSDAHAGTIIRRTKSTLWIRRDRAIRTDNYGMSDCQDYRYEPDENGQIFVAHWSRKYKCFIWQDKTVSVGRHEYYDYSF
ncbi:MAG: hypothetical protein MJ099_04075 [Clostridia bacterium]|nr:hypothetical protein [Clostridia bacterium]